jgi:predicted Zn-dependent protease
MKNPPAAIVVGALVAACFLLPGISGCAVNPVTGRTELSIVKFSEEEEVALGAQAFAPAVQQQGGFYRDRDLEGYVQEVGMRIARASHRPNLKYQYRVLNSSVPNAFAVPGGFIVINRGLLVTLGSEAEMAAVLAHETGHVTAKHSLAAYQRAVAGNVLLSGVSIVTGGSMAAQALGSVTANLLQSGFSRDQEREADALGIDYMVKAGYSPEGMVRLQEFFWTKLEGKEDPMWIEGLFRTHPFSKERLENTRAKVAKDYPGTVKNSAYLLNEAPFRERTARLREVQKAYEIADRGDALLKEKKYDEALAKYREAARMEPEQAPFYSSAGQVNMIKKNTAAAEEDLRKAISLDGEYFEPRLLLGAIRYQRKEYRAAIPELEKSMDLMPTREAATMLSKSYAALGDKARAKKYADMAK